MPYGKLITNIFLLRCILFIIFFRFRRKYVQRWIKVITKKDVTRHSCTSCLNTERTLDWTSLCLLRKPTVWFTKQFTKQHYLYFCIVAHTANVSQLLFGFRALCSRVICDRIVEDQSACTCSES